MACEKIWHKFGMKNMGDYHDHYLKKDILLWADVFEKFIGTCMKYYGLDLCHYFSSPGLSWDVMLKVTDIKLEKISDIDQYLLIEKGTRGGMWCKKLIPNLGNKTKYVVPYINLQLYLSLKMKLTKIHRILQFKQSDWMKGYIDFNTEKRKNAANNFEKDFFKLMINSVYGKTMENWRKKTNVRLVNNEKDFLKYTSWPKYVVHKLLCCYSWN